MFEGLGFRIQGSGFRVQVYGLPRLQILGLRAYKVWVKRFGV